jgi:tRNA A37 threonylcarbamoyladenosine synthetase subunit TsaC/SUA5/YrdC
MAQYFQIHPANPQPRLINRACEIVRGGGIIAYPTDSSYALGCAIGDKTAMERIRGIRNLDDGHNFTLVCRDFSAISLYAKIDNTAVPADQGLYTGAVYIHPDRHPRGSKTASACASAHHRYTDPRFSGGNRPARGIG